MICRLTASATLILVLLYSTPALYAGSAEYMVTFDATWSQATHPLEFPVANPHFSRLIGGVHNSNVVFWEDAGIATDGIESMAETGGTNKLTDEVNAAIDAGHAYDVITGGNISPSPDSVSTTFEICSAFPLATLVSMIAPSPDWFVGVNSLPLRENDQWIDEVVVQLFPYDSGTDSGVTYNSSNANIAPHIPITQLGHPFEDDVDLGTFTFTLLSEALPGDLNDDNEVNEVDVDLLRDVINGDNEQPACGDVNGDGVVNGDDFDHMIEEVLGTAYGDADFNRIVNFDDFVVISNHFNSTGTLWMEGNQNLDNNTNFEDFVLVSTNFGINLNDPSGSVPEPTSFLAMTVAALPILSRRHSRRQ